MKLYYFDFTGRAEAIRLLLTHANVKFEDVRLKFDEWPKHKDEFELKQLPVLEDNGVRFCQSYAIMEYLGAKHGYLPKCPPELYNVMFVMNTTEDLLMKVYSALSQRSPFDEKGKADALEKLLNADGPLFMGALEKRLQENCCKDFLVGHEYTIADFYVLGVYKNIITNEEWMKAFGHLIAEKFPTLHAYAEKRLKDFNSYYKKCQMKLYYFDMPGRAEMIRVMLKHLNIPFEDIRIKFEDWPKLKVSGKFELQQLPLLECEPCGMHLCQADAIMHRMARKSGLLPICKPDILYQVVWWCNTLKDIMEGAFKGFLPIPEEKKKQMRVEFFTKTVPVLFQAMEAKLKANASHEFLVGEKYTMADFYLIGVWRAVVMNPMFGEFKELVAKTPLLNEYFEKKNKLF